ncbi:MAG: type IX secretion system outer membrane channel protein PorV [Cytophagaceae bacterium]|jgi:hypothetical protein|nr:type IX secretion system outer membrane channel protein PorV [Cytophagaceae bacterium]
MAISRFILFITGIFVIPCTFAQVYPVDGSGNKYDLLGRDTVRVITTAVPFLTISPDARSGAMGDVGAAISADANSIFWNPAKLCFSEKDMGFAVSYTPWLRKLGINDMSLSYLAGYAKISKQEAIGLSMNYFNLGKIQFTDNNGQAIREFKPQEFSIGGTYSRKLSDKFSVAPAVKLIYSNLTGSINLNGTTTKPGATMAIDLSAFYKSDIKIQGRSANLAFGAVISNFGGKISYTNSSQRDFIPTNFRLGSALTYEVDQFNKVIIAVDVNKLMVPSPPVYAQDTTDPNGKPFIVRGRNPENLSMFSGVFGSFADAPDGFREEMREFIINTGIEYWYNNLFAVRGGFFNENKLKGNRKYFTLGLGIRYNSFGIDFAYLVPLRQNNPLAETLRFSLHFDMASKRRLESVEDITE